MKNTPPSSGTDASSYINTEEVAQDATDQDVHDLGAIADKALQSLATATDKCCRDEATLALLTLVESIFYLQGWRVTQHNSLMSPALDHIVPLYPDTRSASQITRESLQVASAWIRPSHDYHSLVGGIINYLQGRMRCAITKAGRLVFYPVSSFTTELRNRWFDLQRLRQREAAGRSFLEDSPETRTTFSLLDGNVASQVLNLYHAGIYTPPTAAWYTQHADGLADQALQAQFAHVGQNEVWGNLSKDQVIKAVRPLYLRAARRLLGHIRAYVYLHRHYGKAGPLLSLVETIELAQLSAEVSASAGISASVADSFSQSLLRKGQEERFPVGCYPLVPLSGNRAAFLPSLILFANWPAAREMIAMKTKIGQKTVNRARDKRHTESLKDAARTAGFHHIDDGIEIIDPTTSQPLTDLDVVVVDDACSSVLVIQLKSFLTPTNLLDIDKADDHVREAYGQCARADTHRNEVQTAIQTRLGVSLKANWDLKHIVVVEAVTGSLPPHPDYPAVTLEWLCTQLSAPGLHEINKIWQSAIDLPDAKAFLESIAPAFEVFDDQLRDLKTGKSAAVFAYDAS